MATLRLWYMYAAKMIAEVPTTTTPKMDAWLIPAPASTVEVTRTLEGTGVPHDDDDDDEEEDDDVGVVDDEADDDDDVVDPAEPAAGELLGICWGATGIPVLKSVTAVDSSLARTNHAAANARSAPRSFTHIPSGICPVANTVVPSRELRMIWDASTTHDEFRLPASRAAERPVFAKGSEE